MILLSLLLALCQAPGSNGPIVKPPVGQNAPAPVKSKPDPEFDALENAYKSAISDYDTARVTAERDGRKITTPHPARTWFARFDALAQTGSARAQGWLLENLVYAQDAGPERGRRARELFVDLAEKHPDEEVMVHALAGLTACADDVGLDEVKKLLEHLDGVTHHPEVAAR